MKYFGFLAEEMTNTNKFSEMNSFILDYDTECLCNMICRCGISIKKCFVILHMFLSDQHRLN